MIEHEIFNEYSPESYEVIAHTQPVAEKKERALAMAYIEWQKWQKIYEKDVALSRGTVFEELDLPWIGKEAACDV